MRRRRARRFAGAGLVLALLLAGCAPVVPAPPAAPAATGRLRDPVAAARGFAAVVARMEPVAEAACRERAPVGPCDYVIALDDRPGQPANAFQTEDAAGRPWIVFTPALIAQARNDDELAFVFGHEAAHHIAGHLPRTRASATAGALILGTLTALGGGSQASVDTAQRVGATVGARTFSQEFELEADALGTLLALRGGYDPLRGAEFFGRIPDPGNSFLGTHPPNAARMLIVRQTVAQLSGPAARQSGFVPPS